MVFNIRLKKGDIMSNDTKTERHSRYTLGEEILNSVSHGIGSVLSIAGTIILIVLSVKHETMLGLWTSLIYGFSLILLYTMSTLYHSITNEKAKSILRIFDHTSIFFLIAGSYTPFCLIGLQGDPHGLIVAVVVWACAILGIILNTISLEKTEKLSLILYIAMGWAIIFVIKAIFLAIPSPAFWLLFAGGISYTGGVVFYKMKTKYMHGIWHFYVLFGSVLHFLAVVLYILPMAYIN